MKVLVTGAAGFVGFHLVKKLMKIENVEVIGIDNINDYYDVNLKYARLQNTGISQESLDCGDLIHSTVYDNYKFAKIDIADNLTLSHLFESNKFDVVVNMAAQAGVRYSIENPQAYVHSNITGFTNILECCRHNEVKHLVYASSSSVYGMNNVIPFVENDNVDYPVSFYAATKRSNELMAYTYSHLFSLPVTGVRLFTVYGPWGRPDMAPMLFAEAIEKGESIKVFNNGDMLRDFTYVEDIATGIVKLLSRAPSQATETPFYQIFNVGNSTPIKLLDFIETLEKTIGKKAKLEMLPMQAGDVKVTYADTAKLESYIGYKPTTLLTEGISSFVEWRKSYFQEKL